jgi:hypothetical protein
MFQPHFDTIFRLLIRYSAARPLLDRLDFMADMPTGCLVAMLWICEEMSMRLIRTEVFVAGKDKSGRVDGGQKQV